MSEILSSSDLAKALMADKQRRRAEASLYEFTKQAWHIIEPGTPFVSGWHLECISEHLEAVTAGEIRNLVINIPPRHMKSIQTAVMWPVWVWLTDPSFRWMFASYAGSLSVRDSLKCRRLIESDWFQQRWGHMFKLTGDQNAKTFFENDKSGYRFATSVGASTTGHGGDCLVVDDPHNSMEAQSDVIREGVLDWYDSAMSTRLNNPKTGTKVIVMQRLHEKDLTGHVLSKNGWEHLCLPAEFERARAFSTSIGSDRRVKEGELLWPDRFGQKELEALKEQLGDYGSAGQLQQRPSPAGGGIFKVDNFKLWTQPEFPAFEFVVQSYDTAFTEKTSGDPTACSVWGVFTNEQGDRGAMLIDCWAEHMGYPELRKRVIDDWHAMYGADEMRQGRKADVVLVEQKGSGQSLLQDLRAANVPTISYNPGKADKVSRAHQVSPILEMGVIYIPESKANKGKFMSWAKPLIDQLERFPGAEHDDMVDTFTQAMIMIRDKGLFEMKRAEDDEPEEYDDNPFEKNMNPYAI